MYNNIILLLALVSLLSSSSCLVMMITAQLLLSYPYVSTIVVITGKLLPKHNCFYQPYCFSFEIICLSLYISGIVYWSRYA